MRRRAAAFTLIEMLVSVALVLFIMVILTEAFGKGLESFRTLKAIGDLEARLRSAAAILRRDLAADHFEGKRRLSDPNARWTAMGVPREGFFQIIQGLVAGNRQPEGTDSDGISYGRQLDALYFTVKLRGNNRSEFFTANIPGSPLFSARTTFFNQPADARFQDTPDVYSSQWAEVLYVPTPSGATTPNGAALYTLNRGQLVIAADNSKLNWPASDTAPFPLPDTQANRDMHREISCYPQTVMGNNIVYFNNPSDLVTPANRTFLGPTHSNEHRRHTRWPLTPLLTDVVSFDVDFIRAPNGDLNGAANVNFDSSNRGDPIVALRIRARVWDLKTKQTRQFTIVQEM